MTVFIFNTSFYFGPGILGESKGGDNSVLQWQIISMIIRLNCGIAAWGMSTFQTSNVCKLQHLGCTFCHGSNFLFAKLKNKPFQNIGEKPTRPKQIFVLMWLGFTQRHLLDFYICWKLFVIFWLWIFFPSSKKSGGSGTVSVSDSKIGKYWWNPRKDGGICVWPWWGHYHVSFIPTVSQRMW